MSKTTHTNGSPLNISSETDENPFGPISSPHAQSIEVTLETLKSSPHGLGHDEVVLRLEVCDKICQFYSL